MKFKANYVILHADLWVQSVRWTGNRFGSLIFLLNSKYRIQNTVILLKHKIRN